MINPWTRLTRGRTYRIFQTIGVRGQPPSHTSRVPEDLLRRRGRFIRVPVDQTLTNQLVQHGVMIRRPLPGLILHKLPDGVEPNNVMILEVKEL